MTFGNGTTTDNYKRVDLGTYPHLIIFNDDVANDLAFATSASSSIDGIIKAGEGIEFRDSNLREIYVKSYIAGQAASYRIWGYGTPPDQSQSGSGLNGPEVPKNINTDFNIIKGVPFK